MTRLSKVLEAITVSQNTGMKYFNLLKTSLKSSKMEIVNHDTAYTVMFDTITLLGVVDGKYSKIVAFSLPKDNGFTLIPTEIKSAKELYKLVKVKTGTDLLTLQDAVSKSKNQVKLDEELDNISQYDESTLSYVKSRLKDPNEDKYASVSIIATQQGQKYYYHSDFINKDKLLKYIDNAKNYINSVGSIKDIKVEFSNQEKIKQLQSGYSRNINSFK